MQPYFVPPKVRARWLKYSFVLKIPKGSVNWMMWLLFCEICNSHLVSHRNQTDPPFYIRVIILQIYIYCQFDISHFYSTSSQIDFFLEIHERKAHIFFFFVSMLNFIEVDEFTLVQKDEQMTKCLKNWQNLALSPIMTYRSCLRLPHLDMCFGLVEQSQCGVPTAVRSQRDEGLQPLQTQAEMCSSGGGDSQEGSFLFRDGIHRIMCITQQLYMTDSQKPRFPD